MMKKPNGYWNSFDNIKYEVNNNFPELVSKGGFPTHAMISSIKGLNSLSHGIWKFGGINEVAKIMGCTTKSFYTSDGHFVQSGNEYEFDEFLYKYGIEHQYGLFIKPPSKYRYDFKIKINDKDFYFEIWGFDKDSEKKYSEKYNGTRKRKEEFYKKLEFNLVSIEKDVFEKNKKQFEEYLIELFESLGAKNLELNKNISYNSTSKSPRFWNELLVLETLKELIKEYETFPLSTQLDKNGWHGLVQAICKFGGINHFRKLLGYEPAQQNDGHWTEEKIIKEINKVIDELGYLPSANKLFLMKKSYLAVAMTRNGGVNYYRKLLGLNILTERFPHTDNEIINKIKEINESIGHFPTLKEIGEILGKKWERNISFHGGISKFKKLFIQKYTR